MAKAGKYYLVDKDGTVTPIPSPTPFSTKSSYSESTPSFESRAAGNAGQGIRGNKAYSRGQEEYSAPKANSRAQYKAEKDAGGAQTDLSYEEWKKLD